jgi:hypothetical protein
MSDIVQEAIKYCSRRDYFISVHRNPETNACLAVFPSQTIFHNKIEGCSIFYEITNVGLEYAYVSDDGRQETNTLECPEYSRRILVFQDILNRTFSMGISTKLILYYDIDGAEIDNEGFASCLNGPIDEYERELENSFSNMFYYFLSNPDKDHSKLAQKYGVGVGYNLLTLPFLRKEFES